MHLLLDNTYVIEDCVAGQWGALERERKIKQIAVNDGKKVRIYVEQEPGSGGKESAEATVRMLAGWKAYKDRVTDAKEVRAEPYAAQVQNGTVKCVRGPWFSSFADQHEVFPNGPLKDKVDAAAGAFNKLAESGYDTSLKWID
jgi:predicted phage terminase large subunit-like protein